MDVLKTKEMTHNAEDVVLIELLKAIRDTESELESHGRYGKLAGAGCATGAVVRRRRSFNVNRAGAHDWTNVEYDVAGKCSIRRAESIGLDPSDLEQRVLETAERLKVNDIVKVSFDIVLALSNPHVFDLNGKWRRIWGADLGGCLTLVVLWATWSHQSALVAEELFTWAKESWDGLVKFVCVSCDDELGRVHSWLEERRNESAKSVWDGAIHLWAGPGENGCWIQSEFGKAYALESVPSVILLDFEGQAIAEAVFLEEKQFEGKDPSVFSESLEDAKASLTGKISSALISVPLNRAEEYQTATGSESTQKMDESKVRTVFSDFASEIHFAEGILATLLRTFIQNRPSISSAGILFDELWSGSGELCNFQKSRLSSVSISFEAVSGELSSGNEYSTTVTALETELLRHVSIADQESGTPPVSG